MSKAGFEGEHTNSIRVTEADDGFTVLRRGKPLYDRNSPKASAERRALSSPVADNTCYVVASPLLFYGVEPLHRRLPETSMVCAVEFDEELAALTGEYVGEDTLERIPFIAGVAVSQAAQLIAARLPADIRRIELVRPNGGYRISRDKYDRLLETLRHELNSHWRNVATLVHFGRRWMRNTFRNLGYAASPPPETVDQPVVVCAAGESLERHMKSLRKCRGRLHIMAVDTALGPLVEGGIAPDSVVAIESQVINVGDFLATLPRSTRLFYDLTTHPSVPGLATADRRHTLLTSFAPLSLFERIQRAVPDIIPMSPFASVGLAAVNLACRLADGPVALAGFDFAYTPGKPHARGALSHRISLSRDSRLATPILYDHAMTRPLRWVGTSDAIAYTTEASLSQQAGILHRAIPAGHTVYTLPRTGPDVPVDELTSIEAFLSTHGHNRLRGGFQPIATGDRSSLGGAGVTSFLLEERTRLRRVVSHGDLSGMEYLWMDFADQTPHILRRMTTKDTALPVSLAELNKSLQARVLHRAESYNHFIEVVTGRLRG